nr:immunoglobulin light chain junction region [Macaca mulatta]
DYYCQVYDGSANWVF